MALGDGSAYPTSIDNFADPENKIDVFDARYIADINEAITNIETELGADVAGTAADLVTRLGISLADTGAIQSGTSFPVSPSPIDGQPFFRTDSQTLFIYDDGTAAWVSARSFSNTVFSWIGNLATKTYLGTSDKPATGSEGKLLLMSVSNTTYATVLKGKFLKFNGINTLTVHANAYHNTSVAGDIQVDVGGQTGTAGIDSSTNTNEITPFTIDVSGLSDGTAYDIEVSLKSDSGGSSSRQYIGWLVIFGS